MDQMSSKPIHFAAVNESPEALKLLIEKGANIFDQDLNKKTALHYATIMGRTENIKFLLENQPRLVKVRDRPGYTAMAYACMRNEIPTIEAFLDSKIVKVGTGQGKDRMSPLHWAAAAGNYELCEFLLERKARTLSKDKYARTPLTIACKNGHVRVASLLL